MLHELSQSLNLNFNLMKLTLLFLIGGVRTKMRNKDNEVVVRQVEVVSGWLAVTENDWL
jgi:hypothetical protein